MIVHSAVYVPQTLKSPNFGKFFKQREHAFVALCPTNPAAFLVAGISDDNPISTHSINCFPVGVVNHKPL